ncbi:MAG: serine/threonine-protein kinase [Pseudomonadota bacterium]
MDVFPPQPFGTYLLLRKIGHGGMADVFLAASLAPETPLGAPSLVALKRIRMELSNHKAFVERFVDEAKICALLRHPNIVEVFELGAVGTQLYFTMEWVEGKGLDALYSKLRESGDKLPLEVAAYVSRQIIGALDYAHRLTDSAGRDLRIVHRDVTPGNILLGYDGSVKLSDFGLATVERALGGHGREIALGKLAYVSPEQLKGESADRRADVYSLGVLIHEILTLRRPFEATKGLELQEQILRGEPRLAFDSVSPAPVRSLVRRCLEKDREKRPGNVSEMADAFSSVPEGGRDALAEILRSLFREEIRREDGEKSAGLTAWNDRKLKGADLEEEEPFVEDLLSENVLPSLLEQTEFLPASQAGRATRIAFKANASASSARGASAASSASPSAPKPSSTDTAPSPAEGKDISEVSFVSDLLSVPDSPPPEDTETDPIPEGEPPACEASAADAVPKQVAKIGVVKKHIERPVPGPVAVTEVVATSFPTDSDEVIRLATEASAPKPDPTASQPAEHIQRTSSISPYAEARPRPRRKFKRSLPFAMIGAAATVILAGTLWATLRPNGKKQHAVPKVVAPAWNVSVFLSAESGSPDVDQPALLSWTNSALRANEWLRPLNDFFEREYERWTGQKGVPLSVAVMDPVKEVQRLDWKPSIFHPGRPFRELKALFDLGREVTPRGKGFLFVHLYAKNFWEAPRYPLDFQETRPERRGLVFVPLSPKENEESRVRIAHEILHILGASDKYDERGAPEIPEGIAAPRNDPRYPQLWGEIMSRCVPLAENDCRPLKTLREAAIGDRTAEEIGWSN